MPGRDPAKARATAAASRERRREKIRAKARAHYAAHREEVLAYQAAHPRDLAKRCISQPIWRLKNLDKVRAQGRAWVARNPEKVKANGAAWSQANPEKKRAKDAAWRKANPEKHLANVERHRARKFAASVNDFTAAQWIEMQQACDHRCAYCGRRAKGHLTQDHIIPLSKGGNHTASNIVPACRSCNSKKGNRAVLVPVQPMLLMIAPSKPAIPRKGLESID